MDLVTARQEGRLCSLLETIHIQALGVRMEDRPSSGLRASGIITPGVSVAQTSVRRICARRVSGSLHVWRRAMGSRAGALSVLTCNDLLFFQGDDVEKYVKGSCRPTRTIFVANLDEHTTEEEVTKLFSEHGAVSKFTFKAPKNESAKTQMAMMEMASEAEVRARLVFFRCFVYLLVSAVLGRALSPGQTGEM